MAEKLLNYEIIEKLGEGARSTIYAVLDPVTRRTYALKHVIRRDTKDVRFIEQVETEFAISKNFNHPNLRRAIDLKITRSMLMKVTEIFMVMELFDGQSLESRLPTNLLQLVDAFVQAADGLKAMHAMGYVHCDIKPNNIMRSESGSVKVIDYGQSCKIGTIKERIQGTPDYIAPEQVNRRPVTQQTDVFNLGATMYFAFTGKAIPTLYNVNKQGENSFLLDVLIDPPSKLNPRIPPVISNLIIESISTKPQKRPGDMEQMLQRLELGRHILQKTTNDTD